MQSHVQRLWNSVGVTTLTVPSWNTGSSCVFEGCYVYSKASEGYPTLAIPAATCSSGPILTSQPAPTLTSQPTPALTSQPAPTLTSQPAPTLTSQPTPALTSQPAPTLTSQPTPALTSQLSLASTHTTSYSLQKMSSSSTNGTPSPTTIASGEYSYIMCIGGSNDYHCCQALTTW